MSLDHHKEVNEIVRVWKSSEVLRSFIHPERFRKGVSPWLEAVEAAARTEQSRVVRGLGETVGEVVLDALCEEFVDMPYFNSGTSEDFRRSYARYLVLIGTSIGNRDDADLYKGKITTRFASTGVIRDGKEKQFGKGRIGEAIVMGKVYAGVRIASHIQKRQELIVQAAQSHTGNNDFPPDIWDFLDQLPQL